MQHLAQQQDHAAVRRSPRTSPRGAAFRCQLDPALASEHCRWHALIEKQENTSILLETRCRDNFQCNSSSGSDSGSGSGTGHATSRQDGGGSAAWYSTTETQTARRETVDVRRTESVTKKLHKTNRALLQARSCGHASCAARPGDEAKGAVHSQNRKHCSDQEGLGR